jgi:uncharacterized protein YkwD
MAKLWKLTVFFLFFMLISACAQPTALTPEPSATLSASPTATLKPALVSTETPTPLPTVQTDCKDNALYVADVTIPDNTQLKAGENFTKTWRLKNTGTCIWNVRYALVYVGGEQMGALVTTPLSETPPGAELDLSVNLTAPAADGIYTGLFELRNPQGTSIQIGSVTSIWVKITVGKVVAPAAASLSIPASQVSGSQATPGPCSPQQNGGYTDQILTLLNGARAEARLAPLNLNPQLSAAAQAHTEDMACNNFAGHSGSNGSSIQTRVAAAGYASSYSEEIIFPSGGPQEAFNWWMNDALHRAAILNPKVVDVGVGYTYLPGSAYGSYYTVDFAAP